MVAATPAACDVSSFSTTLDAADLQGSAFGEASRAHERDEYVDISDGGAATQGRNDHAGVPDDGRDDHADALDGGAATQGRNDHAGVPDDGRNDHADPADPAFITPQPLPPLLLNSTPVRRSRRRSTWVDVPLPNANITPLPLDASTLRTSILAIQSALEREAAFQQLQLDYQTMQHQFDTARQRIAELEADFVHTAQQAAPFVQFCQNRYDGVRQDLRAAQRQYDEVVEALADHEGDSARIRSLEAQVASDRQQHATALSKRDRLIDDLQRQLTTALLKPPVPPTSTSAELQLQHQLTVETECHARANEELVRVEGDQDRLQERLSRELVAHSRTQLALAQAQDSVTASETSQKALKDGVSRLRRRVELLEHRLKKTQDDADADLGLMAFERDQARKSLDQAHQRLSDQATQLHQAFRERDNARALLKTHGDQVAAARQSVSRLEQQVVGLSKSATELQRLRAENTKLQTQLASITEIVSDVKTERDRLLVKRANIQSQIAGLSSIVQPPGSSSQLSSHKRHLNRSPTSGSDSKSQRKKSRSSGGSHRDHASVPRGRLGSSNQSASVDHGSGDSDSDSSSQPETGTIRDRKPKRKHQAPRNSTRSRSAKSKSKRSKAKRKTKRQRSDHRFRSGPGDGDGSDSTPSSSSSSGSDGLCSDATLSQRPPTKISRREWLPGYRRSRRFSTRQADPWPAALLKAICVRTLRLEDLFHEWSRPDFWLFPARGSTPAPSHWDPDLITEANVRALYASKPWTALRALVVPRSFNPDGWFEELSQRYVAFEEDEQQTFWESTHAFPVSSELRDLSPYLDKLCVDRKQRRSRAGPRWKKVLALMLEGMRLGHCDLDVFLDPFFLHFPRKTERSRWFPRLGPQDTSRDLITALAITDVAEPWRNQFRTVPRDHPGLHISRLDGKFRPATSEDDDDQD